MGADADISAHVVSTTLKEARAQLQQPPVRARHREREPRRCGGPPPRASASSATGPLRRTHHLRPHPHAHARPNRRRAQ
eukprot:2811114-Prymnesium_polylepis.1